MHKIVFTRSLGYYINQIYIPAFLVVVISWIPFWLDREDSHARVGLGVTTVLTMTTLVTNTNSALPKISYMKSLDIYLEVSSAMVFASLIQYAVVGYFTAKMVNKITSKTNNQSVWMKDNGELDVKKYQTKIDLYSRSIFPSIYIVFNLFYWASYLSFSTIDIDGIILNKN